MQRVRINDGKILSLAEIARLENISLNPNGDPDLSEFGYERFTETPKPTIENAHVVSDGAVFANGQWQTKWVATPYTEAEIAQAAELKAAIARSEAKRNRQALVEQITVTVDGKVFDGDETSQTRMARAIIAMQATNTPATTWVLANNTPAQVTIAELTQALALAGMAQSQIWVIE